MTPLKSSNLAAASYDDATRTLTIKFNSGATWAYAEVPRTIYDGLVDAKSAGQFFAAKIRGQFVGRRP